MHNIMCVHTVCTHVYMYHIYIYMYYTHTYNIYVFEHYSLSSTISVHMYHILAYSLKKKLLPKFATFFSNSSALE